MLKFVETKKLEKAILSGERPAPAEIVELLREGKRLSCVTTCLCPACKEFQTNDEPYIFEAIHVSPYGTIREYRLHFINGKPKCETCGTELIHVLAPRSSKTRCPKCGTDHMRTGGEGFYD